MNNVKFHISPRLRFVSSVLIFTALLLIFNSNSSEAKDLRQFVGLTPNSTNEQFLIGDSYYDLGRYNDAMKAYKKAIIVPKNTDSHFLLGDAYFDLGENKKAMDAYKKAIITKPEDADSLYDITDPDKKIKNKKYSSVPDPNYYISQLNLGHACLISGRYEEGLEAYKRAISINPYCHEAYLGLGDCYRKMDYHELSIEAVKRAIRIKPNNAFSHIALGFDLSELGNYEAAIESYKQALSLEPDTVGLYLLIGRTYSQMGWYHQATIAYHKVVDKEQDRANAHYNLGEIYLQMDYKNLALEEQRILNALDENLANKLLKLIHKQNTSQ